MHPVSFAIFRAKVSSKGLKLSCDVVSDVSVCAVYMITIARLKDNFPYFYFTNPYPYHRKCPGLEKKYLKVKVCYFRDRHYWQRSLVSTGLDAIAN